MARRSDTPTRSEVTEKVEKHQDDMNDKAEDVEETVSDIETVRDTLDSLDLGGTSEGADEVEGAIEGAEDVGVSEFEEESQELEQIQGETEEHEGELGERSGTTSSDMEKISDASSQIHSDAAGSELAKAEDNARNDIEFLDDQADRAQSAREESQRLHNEHQARVSSGRRS